jgi:thioredoxin reductase/NAD-dependent dihydropyrimidine dehydrogenase PreA subunit
MADPVAALLYFAPMALILFAYLRRQRAHHRESVAVRDAAIAAGLTEPASLHPAIDPRKCVGCMACINACPEMPDHKVLGLIHGKAELINPTECIGHGACLAACPVGAITLVFGTERRGVDIPHVGPDFQTNVPGIYIAGELGGMGLIRNAIEQGRQAVNHVVRGSARGDVLDILIIGAGPAGFSASLAAMEKELQFVTIEQESLGGTVAHYPRGKLVMTAPAQLPLVGKVRFAETTKEHLLSFWEGVQRDTGLAINFRERAVSIARSDGGYQVHTDRGVYRSRTVLLAIGRRGTPRKLGVPGEELTKVTYRLVDAEQYQGHRVLVVGGGDSALEAASSLAALPETDVTLSYRSAAFGRAKPANRERLKAAVATGRLRVMMRSEVRAIEPDSVRLEQDQRQIILPNDAVIVSAGGILPTALLESIGVRFETKFGAA